MNFADCYKPRNHTCSVDVGNITIGGGAPVVIQSMTNTHTADIEATTLQILQLANAGSELVRITVNDAEAQVNSTLMTIMGRIAAYTGKEVSWEEIMNSDLYLGPKTYAIGPVPGIPEEIPRAGEEKILT